MQRGGRECRWLCTLMVCIPKGERGSTCGFVLSWCVYPKGTEGVPVTLYPQGVCSTGSCVSSHMIM